MFLKPRTGRSYAQSSYIVEDIGSNNHRRSEQWTRLDRTLPADVEAVLNWHTTNPPRNHHLYERLRLTLTIQDVFYMLDFHRICEPYKYDITM